MQPVHPITVEPLHKLDEFKLNLPPLMHNIPEEPFRPGNEKEYSYREMINMLHSNKDRTLASSLKIWEWSAEGKLLGFGTGGVTLFRTIANIIRSYHLSSYFCGDLYNRVRICLRPEISVSIPFTPIKDELRLTEGVTFDLLHFRFLVAFLVKTAKIELSEVPDDFLFFFSHIFTHGDCLKNRKEACLFQIFHPIFFEGKDRINFMQAIEDYRMRNVGAFDNGIRLDSYQYGLENWDLNIGNFSKILYFKFPHFESLDFDKKCAVLPRFLRNVHMHYAEYDATKSRESIEKELDKLFPGICSKILDCIFRDFDQYDDEFSCGKFYTIFNDPTRGFHPESYS